MSAYFAENQWGRVRAQAKLQWDRISYAELEQARGDPDYLAELVQERYQLDEEDARQWVQEFFDSL